MKTAYVPRAQLVARPRLAEPRRAGWLAAHNSTALQRRIVERALLDVGTLETPLGSNWGVRLARYIEAAGFKKPVPWCGIVVGRWFIDAGALVPADYPDCDAWLPHLRPDPVPGAAVLFGTPGNAKHIEIVARLDTLPMTIGGNRGVPGNPTNDGIGVFGPIPLTRKDVLGYVHPVEVPA